jgi:SAM-dependent methyltransferase
MVAVWLDQTMSEIIERAREIAAFLSKPEAECVARLQLGFSEQHQRVNDDFRRANPKTDDELLSWYRTTEEYIWELSAYHADPGFNYAAMCWGIAERLKTEGAHSVLCLGDGIGDLTISLRQAGFDSVYHDLNDSRTADYARFRNRRHVGAFGWLMTDGFDPIEAEDEFDAVVSLDFLEHVPNVEAWVRAVHAALKPGGIFVSQNAFNIGSGDNGSIPMHLAINDRYEKDWDPLLLSLGFEQMGPQWYRKP